MSIPGLAGQSKAGFHPEAGTVLRSSAPETWLDPWRAHPNFHANPLEPDLPNLLKEILGDRLQLHVARTFVDRAVLLSGNTWGASRGGDG